MTSTLPGADIRGFYAELGIQLPAWAQIEASVCCFADPDAHRRGDRDPSTSVNLQHGAWRCHGCGARGGAYEAARVERPRSTFSDRADDPPRSHRTPGRKPTAATPTTCRDTPINLSTEQQLRRSASSQRRALMYESQNWICSGGICQLLGHIDVLEHLAATRGWSGHTVRQLQLGLDDSRITIPVRDPDGDARRAAALPTQPRARQNEDPRRLRITPRAVPPPRRRNAPVTCCSSKVNPTRSPRDPAACPRSPSPAPKDGSRNGRQLFHQRHVTIALDADPRGRACARQIAAELAAPRRPRSRSSTRPRPSSDGYDLTDWLIAPRHRRPHPRAAAPAPDAHSRMTSLAVVFAMFTAAALAGATSRRRHRHSLRYTIYLRSPLWHLRRRVWILQARGRCEHCRRRWGRQLTIHHLTYKRLGHERREDVQVLCWPCHRLRHRS